jgi:hypothetical protein
MLESHSLESWRRVDDRALVCGLRDAEPEAVDEFIRRFEGLVLRLARQIRIPTRDHGRWAAEVLYEVALTIGQRDGPAPDDLSGYIVEACRLKGHHVYLPDC